MDAFVYCGRCHFWSMHLPKILCWFWHEMLAHTVVLSRPPCRRQPVRHKWWQAWFWLIWTRLGGPLQYLCSLGVESNPASCQYLCVLSCYLRMFLRREPEGGSEAGMDVSRAKNKSSIFPQLLQSLCLRIFQGKTKAFLKQSFHQSCSCEQWSEPSSSFLINTDSQLSPVFRPLGINI